MESKPVVFGTQAQMENAIDAHEARWRRIAREAVAQLRKTADEIEAALNA